MAATPNHDPLLSYRDRFPILGHTNYLISNSLGAVPAAAAEALHEYYDVWASRGVRAWEETWWDMVASLGDLVAPLIGAPRGSIVFQPNVTLSHAVLFSSYDFSGARRRVVTDAMHFPSILYLIGQLAHRGAEIVIVPSDDDIVVDSQRVADAIDDHTAFVSLSHVLFKSAFIHDLEPIVARARAVGAAVIADGYQAVGTIPVDVAALGVDAYVGGCLKWLCGGPGAAFMWVRPDHFVDWAPDLTGWMSHVRPFDFAPELERRADAWRFLHGTPNVPAFYAARAGLEIVNAVGIVPIRSKSRRQTAQLLDLGRERGWDVTAPNDPERRGGTVALNVPHGYEVSKALKDREILCDFRPGAGIRLSPHFYTQDDELAAAVVAVEEILATDAWRAFSGPRSTVT
jgi:kynureninase